MNVSDPPRTRPRRLLRWLVSLLFAGLIAVILGGALIDEPRPDVSDLAPRDAMVPNADRIRAASAALSPFPTPELLLGTEDFSGATVRAGASTAEWLWPDPEERAVRLEEIAEWFRDFARSLQALPSTALVAVDSSRTPSEAGRGALESTPLELSKLAQRDRNLASELEFALLATEIQLQLIHRGEYFEVEEWFPLAIALDALTQAIDAGALRSASEDTLARLSVLALDRSAVDRGWRRLFTLVDSILEEGVWFAEGVQRSVRGKPHRALRRAAEQVRLFRSHLDRPVDPEFESDPGWARVWLDPKGDAFIDSLRRDVLLPLSNGHRSIAAHCAAVRSAASLVLAFRGDVSSEERFAELLAVETRRAPHVFIDPIVYVADDDPERPGHLEVGGDWLLCRTLHPWGKGGQ